MSHHPAQAVPPLAYKNDAFLDSADARPLRILAEYIEPLRHFRHERVHDTVVFFGSARITPEGPLGRYYRDAVDLARLLTEWSHGLGDPKNRFVVCSGGGPGIMEAANRGASEAGGKTVGLNVGLPHEQRPNPYVTSELSFEFRYFFMRKLWFAYLARAMVVFPGGFGTLDELTELLTLSQTGKLSRSIPILLYGSSFWNELIDFRVLARHGLIAAEDLELFQVADEPQQALEMLKMSLAPHAGRSEPGDLPAIACSCDPHTHSVAADGQPPACCAKATEHEGLGACTTGGRS